MKIARPKALAQRMFVYVHDVDMQFSCFILNCEDLGKIFSPDKENILCNDLMQRVYKPQNGLSFPIKLIVLKNLNLSLKKAN